MINISTKNTAKKKPKNKVISARISDIGYLALKKRAKDAGVSLSKFMRSVLLTGKIVQRISKSDADVLRYLHSKLMGMIMKKNVSEMKQSTNRKR